MASLGIYTAYGYSSVMCNNIKEDCPCKNDKCPRHGNCRECVEFHVSKKNKPPFCLRDIEWTEY